MDWEYYRTAPLMTQIKTTTEQDTPQDKERLKITPLKQEIQDKEQHRRATTSHRKAIPKEHDWEYQEGLIEDYDYDNATWRYFRAALRHRFASREARMAEWMNIQQSNTQYCVIERHKAIRKTRDYISGSGYFVRSPMTRKTSKRALQELLGCDRWYGTMPIECMVVWVIETTESRAGTTTEPRWENHALEQQRN
jgi:hypothetical protein